MKLIDNISVEMIDEVKLNKHYSHMILCNSFEKRCVASSRELVNRDIKVGHVIILDYKEYDDEGKKESNLNELKANFSKISQKITVFNNCSVDDPSGGIKYFIKLFGADEFDEASKIIFDLTVFTKPYFFLLFKILFERYRVSVFNVMYTEPYDYAKSVAESEEYVLTEGLDRIESVPGYFGSSLHSQDILIVILGFEGKRSLEVFQNVDPVSTYVINGFPSFKPGWSRRSLKANRRFLDKVLKTDNIYYSPAIDPFYTFETIACMVDNFEKMDKNKNIVIAPLGTKMQAFGAMLCGLFDARIKIIYPFPSKYKTNYSDEIGKVWTFNCNMHELIKSNV